MTVHTPPLQASALVQTSPDDAVPVATAQYDALLTELRDLDAADWGRPTDCTEWTVHDVVCHLNGALQDAWVHHAVRHLIAARRHHRGRPMLDGGNAAQIDERRGRSPGQLVDEMARLAPGGVRMRRRTPSALRRTRKLPEMLGLPRGSTVAYAMDVIYTRDVWMHRVDIARAVGRPLSEAASDREVVAQVVRDLARGWTDDPVVLELSGPAGGCWLIGDGEPVATVRTDAVEYLRLLSGRPASPAYGVDGDASARSALDSARVPF